MSINPENGHIGHNLNLPNGTSGYGNTYNAGFSPGMVGGIPAGYNKFVYQQRLYEEMYGQQNREAFMAFPLTIAVMWTPIGLLLSFVICYVAWNFGGSFYDLGPIIGTFALVVSILLAIWGVVHVLIDPWVTALVLHRRAGGWLAPHLAWADRLLDLNAHWSFNAKFARSHPALREHIE